MTITLENKKKKKKERKQRKKQKVVFQTKTLLFPAGHSVSVLQVTLL